MNIGTAFITNSQSAELMKPTESPLDDPTEDAQAAAVFGVAGRDSRLDAMVAQLDPVFGYGEKRA